MLIMTFSYSSFAAELSGNVSFDVNSARDYVKEEQVDTIFALGSEKFEYNDSINNFVYSYNNRHEVIGITVQYEDEPNMAYIYDKKYNLLYVDKYGKPVSIYPHRGYRYDLDGKLILTSLTVSKQELYRFTPQGALLVHSVNGVMYDENGQVIGTASKKFKF